MAVEPLLTVNDVASILKIGLSTVRAKAESGDLPMFKVFGAWRIEQSKFRRWLDLAARDTGENGRRVRKDSGEMVSPGKSRRKADSSTRRKYEVGSDGRIEAVQTRSCRSKQEVSR